MIFKQEKAKVVDLSLHPNPALYLPHLRDNHPIYRDGYIQLASAARTKAQETRILYFALRPPISLLLSTIPKKLSPW